jgi:hypothetical protein
VTKRIRLEGKKFGRLRVIKVIGKKPVTYHCKCDCGAAVHVRAAQLASKRTRSCGCLQREWAASTGHDLVGQYFGKLLVVAKTDERIRKQVVWLCKCDCGNEHRATTHLLIEGYTQSCGCIKRELLSHSAHDLLGRRFGRLVVVEKTNKRIEKRVVWKCECACGNTWYGTGHVLLTENTKSCGCWQREVASLNGKSMTISDAVLKFGHLMENPAETIKRLKGESNYVEGHD